MAKQQTNIRLTHEERRALRVLASTDDLSVTAWTSRIIAEKWEDKFPGMNYPDHKGEVKPKNQKVRK